MSKATVDKLGDVHGKVADWCIAKLDEEESIMTMTEMGPIPTGKTKKTATASDITAIVNFLAKNDISADISTNDGLNEIKRRLQSKSRHSDQKVLKLPTNLSELKGVRNG